MELNISPLKEFTILIMGPLFQNIAYIILINLFKEKIDLIKIYHFGILIFNLLPIYPLDGGKLITILLNLCMPYKKSLKWTINISYLFTILIFIIQNNISLNIIITIILLIYLIRKEQKRIEYLYNKFILERYLSNYSFKSSKIINNMNNFYRNKRHLIKENNNYYLEKEYLKKKFEKKQKNY